jgi:ribosomal protein L37E
MDDVAEKIMRRSLATEGKLLKCRRCGKTPQDIGWCDECGYNRDYEMVQDATIH